ncbi:MAG TPA: hypothetical protein V6C65_08670, partial [Allocoleopsis sp.]
APIPAAPLPAAPLPVAPLVVTQSPADSSTEPPVEPPAELPVEPPPEPPVEPPVEPSVEPPANSIEQPINLDLDPQIIEDSPVLQRWIKEVPDVRSDIRHDPSFRTRLRLGYVDSIGGGEESGVSIGVEDIFLGRTGLTANANYQTGFEGDWQTYGTDLRYYVLPLGSTVNVAPVVGYRSIQTNDYDAEGVNIGLRVLLVPSRTGAADLAFTQSWVQPGSESEVSLSTFTFAYALTQQLRLSTDLQFQTAAEDADQRMGIGLEWMF